MIADGKLRYPFAELQASDENSEAHVRDSRQDSCERSPGRRSSFGIQINFDKFELSFQPQNFKFSNYLKIEKKISGSLTRTLTSQVALRLFKWLYGSLNGSSAL